jgi:Ca2+-binding RTX toxin-like protein
MAKMIFDPNMGLNHNTELEFNYSGDGFVAGIMGASKASFIDFTNDFSIVLKGEKFKYNDDLVLTGGTVDQIIFLDNTGEDGGEKLATISNFTKKAATLIEALFGEGGVGDFLAEALAHKDTILGSGQGERLTGEGGDDIISGKGGNDELTGNDGDDINTGGGGNDLFKFFGGAGGDDVITDFDLGHEGSFDTLFIRDTAFEIVKAGKNTRVDFADGSSVLLEGVKFKDVADINVDAIL